MHLPVHPAHLPLPVSSFHFPLPTFRTLHRLFLLFALVLTVGTPTTTNATVVIPVADTDLAQQASDIVIGRIGKIKSAWNKNHQQIYTKITLSVDEVLKGDIKKRRLTVTQTGGVVGDVQSWIDGNPEFTVGEKVLLFLSQHKNGSLNVLHLYQGKFSVFTDTDSGMEMAYREAHPEGVHILERSARAATDTGASASDNGFLPLADLKTRIHTALANPHASLPSPPLTPQATAVPAPITSPREEAPFSLLGSPAARWFEPDSGQFVTMKINPDRSLSGAISAAQSALVAWTGVSGSSFKFQYGGTTTAAGLSYDATNAISFGDPLGQISPPSVSSSVNPTTGRPYCSGVLAIGGYFRSGNITTTINGQTYYKIIEGDLVFADGWDNCDNGFRNSLNVAEIATHELGHAMGIGHSGDPDATMYAYAHFDGRGAAIRADDIAALRSIYPVLATAPTCTYTVSTSTVSVGASATSSNVTVTPSASTCTWTTTNVPSWMTVTSGASGTGSGTVVLAIAANTATTARSATLTIAGKSVTVSQAAATPTCSYTVSTTSISVGASATSSNVTVTPSASTCTWTTTNVPSWMTVTSGASGTGSGTVVLAIAANTATTARSATLTIAGKSVTVSQAAASTTAACSFSLPTSPLSLTSGQTMLSFTVTASSSSCSWSASSDASWLSVFSGGSNAGTNTVTFSVQSNFSTLPRTATLTIAGKTVTVTQAGTGSTAAPCTYTVSTFSVSVGASATSSSINVTPSASTCTWTTTNVPSWITLTSGASSTGADTVTLSIAANTATTARSATVTIAGNSVTVSQAAASTTTACTYGVSTTNVSVGAGATSSTVNVTPSASTCTWTTTNVPSWITLTSGASGTGAGTVTLSIAANAATTARSATLTIAGKSVTVSQAAGSTTTSASTCSFMVSGVPASLSSGAYTLNFTVNASSSTCSWSAASNVDWINIFSGGTGTGSGTVSFIMSSNFSMSPRSGTLTIAGQTVTINQSGF